MKLYLENLREGKKSIRFQNKMTYNLETLGGFHERNGTLLETSLLKNYGKLYSLLPKNWGSLYKKVATEKHRFAASKEA